MDCTLKLARGPVYPLGIGFHPERLPQSPPDGCAVVRPLDDKRILIAGGTQSTVQAQLQATRWVGDVGPAARCFQMSRVDTATTNFSQSDPDDAAAINPLETPLGRRLRYLQRLKAFPVVVDLLEDRVHARSLTVVVFSVLFLLVLRQVMVGLFLFTPPQVQCARLRGVSPTRGCAHWRLAAPHGSLLPQCRSLCKHARH